MKAAFHAGALGAALLLTASTASVRAEDRDCTVDLKSLCAGVTPGEGRIQACIQAHISELSVGCSSRLSKAAWVFSECRADINHFCPDAHYGTISDCMRPHLGEVSDQCRGAIAFIASSAEDDTGKTAEKPAHDAGHTIENNGVALTPVRDYLRAKDIPPPGTGAYGIVVFQSKPTAAIRAKLLMVCESFIAFFPRSETSGVPISDQMITIWPLDEPNAAKAKADDCDFILTHYDLIASESAINDARIQHATFDGEGPYLVGWSPSNTRGVPDKLVLVIDMSADNSQAMIDHKFLFWKNKIIENPSLWRSGWSLDGVRVAIKEFADEYGNAMLSAIRLVR